ncbi:MAG: hypothetical protein C0403_04385 [Desulfobacterium sp.]|nr:hypothetical protein [Desulfobacterium sp.]
MKKTILQLTAWVYLISVLLLQVASLSHAKDIDGCLICHQYPGLMKIVDGSQFQPLHIDEAQFDESPHGQATCRSCHVAVVKVPHTGVSQVDCFKECHKEDKETINTDRVSLKLFHKTEQSYLERIDDSSACGVCHRLYPHSRNNIVRSFVNMHTGFLHCEVCHMKREEFPRLTYDWANAENAVFKGRPYGTFFNPKRSNKDGSLNSISRIDVFTFEKGIKRSIRDPLDVEKARSFLATEKNLGKADRKQALDAFHKNTARNKISVACNECHSSNSILDYRQLGFDEKKTYNLKYMNIKGLVTKYQVFYFPKLFGN